MAAADLNARVTAAVAAIDTGDWATALTNLLAAKAYLIGLPNSSTPGGGGLQWDRATIDQLINDVKAKRSAATVGIQTTDFQFVRPGAAV